MANKEEDRKAENDKIMGAINKVHPIIQWVILIFLVILTCGFSGSFKSMTE